MTAYLAWDEQNHVGVNSVEALEALLDALTVIARADMPTSVELYKDDTVSMYIVVGDDVSPVGFRAANQAPIFGSQGFNKDDIDSEYFEFNHRGQYAAIPRNGTIPIADARKALIFFFETGRRPTNIFWEP